MNEEEKYNQEVENCIKAEMQTFYPEEYKRIYKDENINDSLEELKLDLDFANKYNLEVIPVILPDKIEKVNFKINKGRFYIIKFNSFFLFNIII